MNIVIIHGGPRKGTTYKAAERVAEKLSGMQGIDIEWILLKDKSIKNCLGCFVCLFKGEDKCPLKDDRDEIYKKVMAADGLIMAVPNYSLQVPALAKNLLDRLAFVFHRPSMYGKRFMAIVTQGVYGGNGIVKYLNEAMKFWGFGISKGVCITLMPGQSIPEKSNRALDDAARVFLQDLKNNKPPVPTFKDLAIFYFARNGIETQEAESVDRCYYESKGWFKSRYYYDVRLGPVKLLFARIMDRMAKKMIAKTNPN